MRCNHYWLCPQIVFSKDVGEGDGYIVTRICKRCKKIEVANTSAWRRLRPNEFGKNELEEIRKVAD